MSGDMTIRRLEDLDSAALTYAEVKAIASGNPLVIEKAQVDAELIRLTVCVPLMPRNNTEFVPTSADRTKMRKSLPHALTICDRTWVFGRTRPAINFALNSTDRNPTTGALRAN